MPSEVSIQELLRKQHEALARRIDDLQGSMASDHAALNRRTDDLQGAQARDQAALRCEMSAMNARIDGAVGYNQALIVPVAAMAQLGLALGIAAVKNWVVFRIRS